MAAGPNEKGDFAGAAVVVASDPETAELVAAGLGCPKSGVLAGALDASVPPRLNKDFAGAGAEVAAAAELVAVCAEAPGNENVGLAAESLLDVVGGLENRDDG